MAESVPDPVERDLGLVSDAVNGYEAKDGVEFDARVEAFNRLQAQIERVEALVPKWEARFHGREYGGELVDELRAALAAPTEEERSCWFCGLPFDGQAHWHDEAKETPVRAAPTGREEEG